MKSLSTSKHGEALNAQSSVSGAANGEPVLIPAGVSQVELLLAVASGTGKVQYTTSPASAIEADTATWADWTPGVVAADTRATISKPITAVRAVGVSGAQSLEVVGA